MPPNPSPVPVPGAGGPGQGPALTPCPPLPSSPLRCRQWLSDNAELAKQRLAWLKEQLAELLKKTPAS